MVAHTNKCNFWGCDEPICEEDLRLAKASSLRFCQKHSDEINSYFAEWNIPKIMDFWVRSYGGEERMAEKI